MSMRHYSFGLAVTALAMSLLLICPPSLASRGGQAGSAVGDTGPTLEVDTTLPMGPILLGSFSLVLVAVGAGFGWQASQEHDNWKAARTDPRYASDPEAGQSRLDELADDVRAHSIAANVLMISGAALTAVSIIWWVLRGDSKDESEPDVAWRPGLGPGYAGLEVNF